MGKSKNAVIPLLLAMCSALLLVSEAASQPVLHPFKKNNKTTKCDANGNCQEVDAQSQSPCGPNGCNKGPGSSNGLGAGSSGAGSPCGPGGCGGGGAAGSGGGLFGGGGLRGLGQKLFAGLNPQMIMQMLGGLAGGGMGGGGMGGGSPYQNQYQQQQDDGSLIVLAQAAQTAAAEATAAAKEAVAAQATAVAQATAAARQTAPTGN